MNLNYAIFRSELIYTINDLAQIRSHNKREKKTYQSNFNIKLELTKNNTELVLLTKKMLRFFITLQKNIKNNMKKNKKLNKKIEKRHLSKC